MKFIITSIEFDTDGDKIQAKKLRKEWIGKTFEAKNRVDANQRGADIISDQCGWCILSLDFKVLQILTKGIDMATIIIQIRGGLVQEVFIKGKGIPSKAIVVDEDAEGSDLDEITTVEIPEGTCDSKGKCTRDYEAVVHTEAIKELPRNSDVDRIVKAYQKNG